MKLAAKDIIPERLVPAMVHWMFHPVDGFKFIRLDEYVLAKPPPVFGARSFRGTRVEFVMGGWQQAIFFGRGAPRG